MKPRPAPRGFGVRNSNGPSPHRAALRLPCAGGRPSSEIGWRRSRSDARPWRRLVARRPQRLDLAAIQTPLARRARELASRQGACLRRFSVVDSPYDRTRRPRTRESVRDALEAREIFDAKIAKAFGPELNQCVVTIHCGSRGLGHQIGTEFLREMAVAAPAFGVDLPDRELACAPIRSELGQRYLGVGIHLNTRNHSLEVQWVAKRGKFEKIHLNGSASISVATECPVST